MWELTFADAGHTLTVSYAGCHKGERNPTRETHLKSAWVHVGGF
jgi:hypothetical protein